MQGGLRVDFQINLRDGCLVADGMLLGYTKGHLDVSNTSQRFSPRLKADTERAIRIPHVLVGTGERMLDHAPTHIYQMPENLMGHCGSGLS